MINVLSVLYYDCHIHSMVCITNAMAATTIVLFLQSYLRMWQPLLLLTLLMIVFNEHFHKLKLICHKFRKIGLNLSKFFLNGRLSISILTTQGHVKLYRKRCLVSPGLWPQFLIFQKKNTCAQTSMFLIFRSVHKNFVEKLKIVFKNSEKINCSYGKVLHDLKIR